MRIRPDNGSMHQRRTMPASDIIGGLGQHAVRSDEVRSIHFHAEEIRKALEQTRDIAARGLTFDRNRNRVAVILNKNQQRQLVEASDVHGLPELTFTRSAFASGYQGDFI